MSPKGRYHPSRISGIRKFLTALAVNKKESIKRPMKPLDTSKEDWSIKKGR